MGQCIRTDACSTVNNGFPSPRGEALQEPEQQEMRPDRVQPGRKRDTWVVDPSENRGTGFKADEEALQWLNFVLEEGWQHIDRSVQRILKDDVEPALKEALPSPIKDISFTSCSLGDAVPRLSQVRVYKKHRQKHIGIEIDVDFNWDCNAQIELSMMHSMLGVGIKQITVNGTVSIVLRPLLDSLPIVGGLQIFMISPPDISWDMAGIGNIVDAPLISGKVREIVLEQISKALVLPNRLFVHWIYGREREVDITSLQFPRPEGVARIGVVAARGLDAKDWSLFGRATSDPYAVIQVGSRTHKTPTINRTVNPEWGDAGYADFFIFNPRQLVQLTVFDADYTGSETIGQLQNVRLHDLLAKGDAWFPIMSPGDNAHQAGEVRLIVEAFELAPEASTHSTPDGVIEEADRKAEAAELDEARKLLTTPPPRRGKEAGHTALLQVQIQCLRGLPVQKAAGVVMKLEVEDETFETNPSILQETAQDLLYDARAQMIDPAAQRLAEYLASNGEDIDRIAHVSGLDPYSLKKVLNEMPSFTCRWDQGFNVLLKDVNTAKVDLSMKSPRDEDQERLFCLPTKYLVVKLLESPTLEWEGNLDLKPKVAGGSGAGAAASKQGPESSLHSFDIRVKLALYGFRKHHLGS